MSEYSIKKIVNGDYCIDFGKVISKYDVQRFLEYQNSCKTDPFSCVADIDGEHKKMYACLSYNSSLFYFDDDKDFIGRGGVYRFDWLEPPAFLFYCNNYHLYFDDVVNLRRRCSDSDVYILNNKIISLIKYNNENDIDTNGNIVSYLKSADGTVDRTFINCLKETVNVVRLSE